MAKNFSDGALKIPRLMEVYKQFSDHILLSLVFGNDLSDIESHSIMMYAYLSDIELNLCLFVNAILVNNNIKLINLYDYSIDKKIRNIRDILGKC